MRLGGVETIKVDVRIIAATNRDLEIAVHQGSFRRDLYFRLNVVSLRLPPLRERKEDIRLLVDHFLEKISRSTGTRRTISTEAMKLMLAYDWPGNVRELENCLERASALSSGPVLNISDLPPQVQNSSIHAVAVSVNGSRHRITPLADMEKQAILAALNQLNGDKMMTAKLLGIGKTTLYRKLKEYGITDRWGVTTAEETPKTG